MRATPAVPGEVLALLEGLRDSGALNGFYLAGGTSLALRFGHRVSRDLDFFHPTGFDGEAVLAALAAQDIAVSIEHQDAGTLRLFAGPAAVKVEYFRYLYPLVHPTDDWQGVALAAPADVALMKLNAVASRGSRKDFLDLYWLCERQLPLRELLRLVPLKFARRLPDPYHLARSLGYFADADAEPAVNLLNGPAWPAVRSWFAAQAEELLREIEAGHNLWN